MTAALSKADAPADPGREANKVSERKPLPAVRMMHLQRAMKRGLIRSRADRIGAVNIMANSMFALGRIIKGYNAEAKLLRWIERREVKIGRKTLTKIIKRWRDKDQWTMTVEDTGALLSLSVEERLEHELWTLGARNESEDERHARRRERAAAREAARRKGQKKETVAAFAAKHGVSRALVYKWLAKGKARYVEHWTDGVTVLKLEIVEPIYKLKSVTPTVQRPWEAEGVPRSTYFYRKAKAKKAAAGPAEAGAGAPQSPNHPVEKEIVAPMQRTTSISVRRDFTASIVAFERAILPAIRATAAATAEISRKVEPVSKAARRLASAGGRR